MVHWTRVTVVLYCHSTWRIDAKTWQTLLLWDFQSKNEVCYHKSCEEMCCTLYWTRDGKELCARHKKKTMKHKLNVRCAQNSNSSYALRVYSYFTIVSQIWAACVLTLSVCVLELMRKLIFASDFKKRTKGAEPIWYITVRHMCRVLEKKVMWKFHSSYISFYTVHVPTKSEWVKEERDREGRKIKERKSVWVQWWTGSLYILYREKEKRWIRVWVDEPSFATWFADCFLFVPKATLLLLMGWTRVDECVPMVSSHNLIITWLFKWKSIYPLGSSQNIFTLKTESSLALLHVMK